MNKKEKIIVKCSICGRPMEAIRWEEKAKIAHMGCVLKETEHLRK